MKEHGKWESNKEGGWVFITVSDGSPVFVAEALGATREIKVKRARLIAQSPVMFKLLEELTTAFPETEMRDLDAADFVDRSSRIWSIVCAARMILAKA